MPSHLSDLPSCIWRGCTKKATKELRNTYNAVLGTYCAKHGQAALERQRELDA